MSHICIVYYIYSACKYCMYNVHTCKYNTYKAKGGGGGQNMSKKHTFLIRIEVTQRSQYKLLLTAFA